MSHLSPPSKCLGYEKNCFNSLGKLFFELKDILLREKCIKRPILERFIFLGFFWASDNTSPPYEIYVKFRKFT